MIESVPVASADLVTAALQYAGHGYRVLALHSIRSGKCTCGNSACTSPGKHPLTPNGLQDASTDEVQIRGWWSKWPWANIGLALGQHGLFALDVDERNGGHLTLEDVVGRHGALPDTPTQRTGNGQHFVMWSDRADRFRGKLGPGIDVKVNGYIVAEPSIHATGRRYAWEESADLLQGFAPARAPHWLDNLLTSREATPGVSAGIPMPEHQARELRSALAVLDADDYDEWIQTGMALHSTGAGDQAFGLWAEWSQQSDKYDPRVQRDKWRSFDSARDQALTVRSIFAKAQGKGWANPMAGVAPVAKPAQPEAPASYESGDAFAEGFQVPEYVIDGILLRGYLHGLTGRSNAGKTAIGLSFCYSVALGRPFGGIKVEQGNVLFLAGENPQDVRLRVRGFKQFAMLLPSDLSRLHFRPGRFDLVLGFDGLKQQAEQIGGFSLVVVDSAAAFFQGEDENSNPEMVAHAMAIRRLTELPGRPAVVVLCHPSKHAEGHEQLMPRGGSAFLNELDANLTAWKEGEVVQLGQNKVRGPAFDVINLQLFVWKFEGVTTNLGSPVTSVIAIPADAKKTEELENEAERDENAVLSIMRKAGDKVPSMREIAQTLGWIQTNGEPAHSRVNRCIGRLAKDKLVRKYRRKWVLTDAGKGAKDGA